MQLTTLNIFLSDATAKAVCWTLVHSVWQGILAALVAGQPTLDQMGRMRVKGLRLPHVPISTPAMSAAAGGNNG